MEEKRLTEEETARLRHAGALVLSWYDAHARALPWRAPRGGRPDPYRVWISEIMLQQTRAEAVIPYYERFLAALPDVAALADADGDRLNKLWEGLGYYSRARSLQKAARALQERFGGRLPSSYEALLTLPGVGPYTAGAIASIAFGIPVPAVDGNLLRVLARFLNERGDVVRPGVRRFLTGAAAALLDPARPGDCNQALMDLGALVCVPHAAPRCADCPISAGCAGFFEDTAASLPVRAPKKPRTVQQKTVLLVTAGERVLLRKRPARGLLAGLWEFPNGDGRLSAQDVRALPLLSGLEIREIRPLPDARHVFTHREWHMAGFSVAAAEPSPVPGCVWADREELSGTYALPSAFSAFARELKY